MEILRKVGGKLEMVHVPYKGGAGPAVAGLVGGETHLMFVTASSAMPVHQGGPPQGARGDAARSASSRCPTRRR